MADIIQKATEFDKQAAAFRKKFCLEDLAATHYAQPKYDGCHLIVDTSSMTAFSRTNEPVRSCDHIIDNIANKFGQGWVVQGEVWHPAWDFPKISGAYRRHTAQQELSFMAYDCLPTKLFHQGADSSPYEVRLKTLREAIGYADDDVSVTSNYNPGTYIARQLAEQFKERGGYDGIILRDPTAPWVRGPARNGELVKVKPTLSLDLKVTGYRVAAGDKTGRDVVTLAVLYKNTVTWVGSGVPHDLKGLDTVGKIIEVEAMGVTADGSLREPRFKGIRFDKDKPDA